MNVQYDTIRPVDRGTNNKFAVYIKKYRLTKNRKVAVQDKDLFIKKKNYLKMFMPLWVFLNSMRDLYCKYNGIKKYNIKKMNL